MKKTQNFYNLNGRYWRHPQSINFLGLIDRLNGNKFTTFIVVENLNAQIAQLAKPGTDLCFEITEYKDGSSWKAGWEFGGDNE